MAQQLGELDEVLQGTQPLQARVSYDMTKNPPQPILDSQTGNSPWLDTGMDQQNIGMKIRASAVQSQERNDSWARRDHRSESQQAANPGQYQTGGGDEVSA